MKLDEARELREELEAVEATMRRIKELWLSDDFPSGEQLEELARAVGNIAASMEQIQEAADKLPTADDYEDLGKEVGAIAANLETIREHGD
jgi:hypothetical protein